MKYMRISLANLMVLVLVIGIETAGLAFGTKLWCQMICSLTILVLFVAAIAWQRCDLRRSCGSKKLSAEATNSPKKKAPTVGAGGRARPGPKFAERIEHRPRSLCMWERCWRRREPFSLSHIIGPIPLSRSDPLPGNCSMTPEICSMRPSRWGVLSSTSGQSDLAP